MQGREDHPRSVDMLGGEEDFGGGHVRILCLSSQRDIFEV